MKSKIKIAFLCVAVALVSVAASLIAVFAAQKASVSAPVEINFIATKVVGTVKAEYRVVSSTSDTATTWTEIGTATYSGAENPDGSGKRMASNLDALDKEWHGSPYIIQFRFTFTNTATVAANTYDDTWKVSLSAYPNSPTNFTVAGDTATSAFYVYPSRLSSKGSNIITKTINYTVADADLDANFSGTFTWNIDAEYVAS